MFDLIENVRIALSSLGSNKMRTGLTMLGMTIGIASVILLVSVGQAVETFVVSQFTSFGSNLIFVFGTESEEISNPFEAEDEDFFIRLSESDLEALSAPFALPDALNVTGMLELTLPVTNNEIEDDVMVAGIMPNYFDAMELSFASGRNFDEEDLSTAARVAILGPDTAEQFIGSGNVLGQIIRVNDVNFEVVGVLDEITISLGQNPNEVVLVPLTTAQKRLSGNRLIDGDYPVSTIMIKAMTDVTVDETARQISEILREERNIASGEKDDFQVLTQNQFVETLQTITGLLTIFLAVIAGISLMVGGIGIMNIMLVTVTERTREIGLRKAVGAQNRDILAQFLVEAVVLAILGGGIGVMIAVGASTAATRLVPNLEVTVYTSSIMMATMISVSIGTFFGIYPANRAAHLRPIDALRYE